MDKAEGTRFLVFEAEGRRYACTLGSVREIVPFRGATRLPGAPPAVVGLINLRGRLVTVVDLSVQLGAREAGGRAGGVGSIVMLGAGTRLVGLLVDEVRDVRPVDAEAVEPIPEAADGQVSGTVRALARLDDGVAVVLDPDAIINDILQ
jgi:purine-binding chemotaxis protein CheW